MSGETYNSLQFRKNGQIFTTLNGIMDEKQHEKSNFSIEDWSKRKNPKDIKI